MKLYENERNKLNDLEKKFVELREEYNEMQEMIQTNDDEDQFK